MKTFRLIAFAAMVTALCSLAAPAQTIPELEKQVADNPISIKAKEALAETYLRECHLEKSLRVWQAILSQAPDHGRAGQVVSRLTLQALDLDSHLDVLDTLIEKGILRGTDALIEAAAQRAATDTQKARILYLRGKLALRRPNEARARESFETALRLYPDSRWSAYAAIDLADAECKGGRPTEARRRLREVIDNPKFKEDAVREAAMFKMALLASDGLTPAERVAALRDLLKVIDDAEVKRQVLGRLAALLVESQGRWVPEAVAVTEEILRTNPPHEQASRTLEALLKTARISQDTATLDRVLALVRDSKIKSPMLKREMSFIGIEALLSRAVIENGAAEVKRLARDARRGLDELARQKTPFLDQSRIGDLRGRAYMVEAQKLVALAGPTEALPVLLKAKDHYLARLPGNPQQSLSRLEAVGRLLEHTEEWETAVAVYRELATRFPHLQQGRDALLKIARLHERNLNAPLEAVEAYADYAARYPAELPYRQLALGKRLQRLGYANLLDFQKRRHLKADGIFGPKTAAALAKAERSFDVISVRRRSGPGLLRGVFVHPYIFRIARRLDKAGRHHDAVVAYRTFLNLFPTKREADDALIAIARLMRDNLLFAEALGAYRQLMDDFPKGNVTSEAYVEAAGCCENLGMWEKARQYYELYAKKFPKYKHIALCKARLAQLEEIQQYADFIASNPTSPKLAEARYQIATVLYKKLKNPVKAAMAFRTLAAAHPKHARAPEGMFMAGTAQLHAQNFPAAREAFAELVRGYPESRLADDGQYWIGHTYEYSARAIGKLDNRRIILKRRSLRARARLRDDLPLRRHYNPEAKPGHAVPEDVWGGDTLGVLASGSVRDRVNADLFRAIRAYRKVADNFKMGDMAGPALLRIGTIYVKYLKDPDRGISAYQELLAHYPASAGAVDALFEVGGYHTKKNNFDDAIKAYRQFIYNYPKDARVAEARLAIARCYVEKKDWHKALDAYQSYLNKFPDAEQADFAKAQVEWIRMYHF